MRRGPFVRATLALAGCLVLAMQARATDEPAPEQATWTTRAVGPHRTIAVHGRRALVVGFATGGLEAWAYPLQIFRDYRIAVRVPSSGLVYQGDELLNRIDVEPYAVTRSYLGAGFSVRERIFVPLDRAAAVVTYTVNGREPVEIQVRATAVLNLMWPASLDRQSFRWSSGANGYVLAEPVRGLNAVVGSHEAIAHEEPANDIYPGDGIGAIDLTLRPDRHGEAHFAWALNAQRGVAPDAVLAELLQSQKQLEKAANAHMREVLAANLRITTPDAEVNRALASDALALDQAWACNDNLGCGFVGGYGPSHAGRRPQYAWFFAGDGLVAANAAIDSGAMEKARDELEFILRYQDAKTGMIWHELSQSAGWIDWVGKYPYMYVHVDISFDFIATVARYIEASGDTEFLRRHWSGIEAAYRYCASLVDRTSGLPRIPRDKEGGNEQQALRDDLGLSTSWVSAAEGFSQLAALAGNMDESRSANNLATKARAAVGVSYWDFEHHFWLYGHTQGGAAFSEPRSTPAEALELHLFDAAQQSTIFSAITGCDFSTDWGLRSVSAAYKNYDPDSYAQGSVWPVNTAEWARVLWSEGRSPQAFALWRTLIPLHDLDALAHVDEVLAGDTMRPQRESVPEQTWSTAGELEAAISGMLGLRRDGIHRVLHFSPHLPAQWETLHIDGIRLQETQLSLDLRRGDGFVELTIENSGAPFTMEYEPELPLGAQLRRASFAGRPLPARMSEDDRSSKVQTRLDVPHGESHVRIAYDDGVAVWWPFVEPLIGDTTHGVFVTGLRLDHNQLLIDADVPADRESVLYISTHWRPVRAEGAQVRSCGNHKCELRVAEQRGESESYRHVRIAVEFERSRHGKQMDDAGGKE